MKIITILFLFTIANTFSQSKTEFLNFTLNSNKKLVWEMVYKSDISLDQLSDFLVNKSFTYDLKLRDSSFIGRSDKNKLSKINMNTIIAAQQSYTVFLKIKLIDNGYKVIITDLSFDPTTFLGSSMGFTLEQLAVKNKKHEIRSHKAYVKLLTLLDKDFTQMFKL